MLGSGPRGSAGEATGPEGLVPALLASMAANLASPDTDNISAVAWIETLVEVGISDMLNDH